MSENEKIDFNKVAGQIVEISKQPTPDASGDPKADAKLAELRRIGLHYVIEFDAVEGGAGVKIDDAAHLFQVLQQILKEDIFGDVLQTTPRPDHLGPLLETQMPLEIALTGRPHLARFVSLRIHGCSFDDLDEALQEHGERNSHDMAYELRDMLNAGLAKRGHTAITVKHVVANHPFIFTCHREAHDTPILWPLECMHVNEAWALAPPPGGKRLGEGILVGHIDTGWSEHPAMQPGVDTDFAMQFNAADNTSNAKDPLKTTLVNSEPGHGTSTATLIASAARADWETPVDEDGVVGVATRARVLPIRVCDGTAFFCNSKVATGLAWAVKQKCHVVSMSIGGFFLPQMQAIVEEAYKQNMIIIASAGNCWPAVVNPAAMPQCVAVAATNEDDEYWKWSPQGPLVDIAAPGVNVRTTCIQVNGDDISYSYNYGSGGSFATAYVAGAAALWRAFHGEEVLKDYYPLQDTFAAALKASARKPDDWDTATRGAGIIDVEALLKVDLKTLPRTPKHAHPPGSLAEFLGQCFPTDIPFVPPPRIRGLEILVGGLMHQTFGENGQAGELIDAAEQWFGVQGAAEALQKITHFGYEMSQILITRPGECHCANAPPPDYHAPVGIEGARAHFWDAGSKALREALHR
ncbi:MAG TPA: S8 family serine peptidase [Rhizomicrobium sp.]|jgi:hypothetical protein